MKKEEADLSLQIMELIDAALLSFDSLTKRYVLFHIFYAALGVVELCLLAFFLGALAASSMLAMALAVCFLTLFSFFIFRLYLVTQRPEKMIVLRDHYLATCKEIIGYQEGTPEHHTMLSSAAFRFAAALRDREYHYWAPPYWLDIVHTTQENFSCWWHWNDVHTMKEMLLLASVQEHIRLVRCEPTNLEVHASLANAYVMLSSIYADPRKGESIDPDRWIPAERYSVQMQHLFRTTAERAIEEFKILNAYAPDDPWVHLQLAYSYHDLQMPEEEIREYEMIRRIEKNDLDILYKLGMLYFQQGHNAKGLEVFEELKESNYDQAESLISYYGSLRSASQMEEALYL